ncbi:MAG: phage tail protein [Pyrinomonadaceae bacterium]
MGQPFVGEIRMFGGNFAPAGWMFCNGQLLPISENDTLFNLIGTTYGGDGQSTFALPNLQSRVPVHVGPGFAQAQMGGVETVTLTTNQIPSHTHPATCYPVGGNTASPAGARWASSADTAINPYAPGASADSSMNAGAVGMDGGNQPHDNMLPFLCISFIISLFGIFPSQN